MGPSRLQGNPNPTSARDPPSRRFFLRKGGASAGLAATPGRRRLGGLLRAFPPALETRIPTGGLAREVPGEAPFWGCRGASSL